MKIDTVKKLHDFGFSLIYLKPKDKAPLENGWTKQPNKSWAELENSFESKYNLGVRLGKHSKLKNGKYLTVVDCDVKSKNPKHTKEMENALKKLMGDVLETAPTVASGRGNGSKHIYVATDSPDNFGDYARSEKTVRVRMPSVTRISKRERTALTEKEISDGWRLRPAWEISIMGDGRQTVLPPSIHPDTGARYTWLNPFKTKSVPTLDLSKFVKLSDRKVTKKNDFIAVDVDLYANSRLSLKVIRMIEDGEGVDDGSAALMTVALSMCRAGFTDNEILSVLSDDTNYLGDVAYKHRQTSSRASAVDWLWKYTLSKAREETSVMKLFQDAASVSVLSDDEVSEQDAAIEEDVDVNVLPDKTKDGGTKVTYKNVLHILEQIMGPGVVGLNEFDNRVYFLKDTPYGGVKGRELSNNDDLNLKTYITQHFEFEPGQATCFEAHTWVAGQYRFHPVREYLNGLKWDGVERLDFWLTRALGATGPGEYVQAVARKTLCAAVTRVFEPGCKFDYVMILEGVQGRKKSTTLEMLASEKWFTDNLGDIFSKDVVDQMVGKWIIELAELASIRKADQEHLKGFITRKIDRVRLPYGRRSEDFPRQCIFIGSTNQDEYLQDETGNRRYWPVKITKSADVKWLKVNREQLWAEAVVKYKAGETLFLLPEIEEMANTEQSKRFQTDEWEKSVSDLMSDKPEIFPATTTLIWQNVTQAFMDQPQTPDTMRLSKILKRLGLKRMSIREGKKTYKGWKLP